VSQRTRTNIDSESVEAMRTQSDVFIYMLTYCTTT